MKNRIRVRVDLHRRTLMAAIIGQIRAPHSMFGQSCCVGSGLRIRPA